MSSVAIITARGGSKRIPGKNIRDFCGKPIIAYSIEAALESGAFDSVMVSTDDKKIADIAKQYGAAVPFMRSAEASDDHATSADAIADVLNAYKERDIYYDIFCCLYPTAPFVTADRLRKAYDVFSGSDATGLVTIVKYDFPPQRCFVIKDGLVEYKYPEYRNSRSQDLESIYHDCGQFYFCRVPAFLEEKTLITSKTIPFEIPEEEVQDIDTLSDWNIAEIKYKRMISS